MPINHAKMPPVLGVAEVAGRLVVSHECKKDIQLGLDDLEDWKWGDFG